MSDQVMREINEPRLPTVMAIMRASKKPTTMWTASDLGLTANEIGSNGSLVKVLRSTVSGGERKRIVLQGDSKEIASRLIKDLVQEGALKVS